MAETKRLTAEQVFGYLFEGERLDFPKESLFSAVQQLMEAGVSELIAAAHGERAPKARSTHRSGYCSRAWSTCAGGLES
jgi:transposase-like protein